MPTIKTKELSKDVLIFLIDEMRKAKYLPEHLIVGLYNQDLRKQLYSINKQLEAIEKAAKDKKLSRKAYAVLVKKNNRLVALFNKKVELIQGLEDSSNTSKP